MPATQDEIADDLGVNHHTIGRLERGESVVNADTMRQAYRKWLRDRELPLEQYIRRFDVRGRQAQKLRWARVVLRDGLRTFADGHGMRGSKTRRSIWFWSEYENGRIALNKQQTGMVKDYIREARAELARLMRKEVKACRKSG